MAFASLRESGFLLLLLRTLQAVDTHPETMRILNHVPKADLVRIHNLEQARSDDAMRFALQ